MTRPHDFLAALAKAFRRYPIYCFNLAVGCGFIFEVMSDHGHLWSVVNQGLGYGEKASVFTKKVCSLMYRMWHTRSIFEFGCGLDGFISLWEQSYNSLPMADVMDGTQASTTRYGLQNYLLICRGLHV